MSLEQLPVELLHMICKLLDAEDLLALTEVCTALDIALDHGWYYWETVFYETFPRLKQRSCQMGLVPLRWNSSWRELLKKRLSAAHELMNAIDELADTYFRYEALPDKVSEVFRGMVPKHGSLLNRDALLDIIFPKHLNPDEDLVQRHYATMLYREVQREEVLLRQIRRLFRRNIKQLVFLPLSYMMSQWKYPEIPDARIHSKVERFYVRLASRVITELKEQYPDHPVSKWTEPLMGESRAYISTPPRSLWGDGHCTQVLTAMNDVFFHHVGVRRRTPVPGASPDDVQLHTDLALLHGALNQHNPPRLQMMRLLYVTVAAMLGVLLENMAGVTGKTDFVRWDGDLLWFVIHVLSGQTFTPLEIQRELKFPPESFQAHPGAVRSETVTSAFWMTWCAPFNSHEADVLSVSMLMREIIEPEGMRLAALENITADLVSAHRPMVAHRFWQNFMKENPPRTPEEFERVRELAAREPTMRLTVVNYSEKLRQLEEHHDTMFPPPTFSNEEVSDRTEDTAKAQETEEREDCGGGDRKPSGFAFCAGDLVICPRGHRAVVVERVLVGEDDVSGVGAPQPGEPPVPCYYLLCDQHRYARVPERRLKLTGDMGPVVHYEIGRYFFRYYETGQEWRGYEPLPYLEETQPRDRLPTQLRLLADQTGQQLQMPFCDGLQDDFHSWSEQEILECLYGKEQNEGFHIIRLAVRGVDIMRFYNFGSVDADPRDGVSLWNPDLPGEYEEPAQWMGEWPELSATPRLAELVATSGPAGGAGGQYVSRHLSSDETTEDSGSCSSSSSADESDE